MSVAEKPGTTAKRKIFDLCLFTQSACVGSVPGRVVQIDVAGRYAQQTANQVGLSSVKRQVSPHSWRSDEEQRRVLFQEMV